MPAIPYKKYPMSDKPWDGPKNEANLKSGQNRDYYDKAYAWIDPKADDTTKSAYKFIHAECDTDGNIGDTNIKACQTGIAVLNGAMGGTTIPDADRQGVYNHLSKHLKDAGIEPAELKSRSKNPFGVPVSCRAVSDISADTSNEKGNVLQGHVAVFGQSYQVTDCCGTYNEVIERGAFDKSDLTDVPFTFNHNIDQVPMARSRNNTPNSTLQLDIDNVGLGMKASLDLENNDDSRKTYSAVSRGDLADMSYIFAVRSQNGQNVGEWWEGLDDDSVAIPTRHITDVAKVFEVSAVTWGANPGTDISARGQGSPESESALERARNELESSKREQEARSKETQATNEREERRKRLILKTYC